MNTIEYRNLPAVVKQHLPGIVQPENYQLMIEAINNCFSVDDCAEWANKAAAAAAYYKQSQDKTLEEKALRIRLRAQLKCWELIKELRGNEAIFPPQQRVQLNKAVKVPVSHRNFLINDSPPITLTRLAKIGSGEPDEPRPTNKPIRGGTSNHWDADFYASRGAKVGPNKYPGCAGYVMLYDCCSAMKRLDPKKEAAKMPPEANIDLRKLIAEMEEWLYQFENNIPVRIKRVAK
jgi:hypothetical protein